MADGAVSEHGAHGSGVVDTGVLRRGMRLLALCIRGAPKPFAISVAGASVWAGMTIASSIVFGRVTDRVIVPSFRTGNVGAGALTAAAAAIVGVSLVKALAITIRRYYASVMLATVQAEYRRRLGRQYLRLPLSWHQRHSTGELLSTSNSDVESMFWPINPLPMSIGVVVMLVGTIGVLFATDVRLAIVGLLIFPAIALVNWRFNAVVKPRAMRAQQLRGQVSGVAHESFDAALVVKTLGREAAETARFRERSDVLRDEMVHIGQIRATFDPVIETLPTLGVLVVLLVGSGRVASGDLAAGELVKCAYLFTLLAFPVRALGWVLGDLPRAVVGWERVERILRARGQLEHGDVDLPVTADPARLSVRNVDFSYVDTPTLTDVSFDVAPGTTVAVVGATGSGKSTIAALLVRLLEPAAGRIEIDGHDLITLSAGALSRHASFVPQQAFVFDDTIRGNIALGAPTSDEQLRAAARLAQAERFIDALPDGFDTLVGERGTSLSGGQRQRLALARALVRRPRLLVLDDATSSVDPQVEAAILRGLAELPTPMTLVVVAYRRATIALADDIVFVDGGVVRDRGTHEALMSRQPGYVDLITAYDKPDESTDSGDSDEDLSLVGEAS
ncbi:MAG: ABC transporter ATP-binding protein [Mycobacteriales bacterium]